METIIEKIKCLKDHFGTYLLTANKLGMTERNLYEIMKTGSTARSTELLIDRLVDDLKEDP